MPETKVVVITGPSHLYGIAILVVYNSVLLAFALSQELTVFPGQTRSAERSSLLEVWSFLRVVRRAVFLPKKEPSAIFPEEIGHFLWQLLYKPTRHSSSARTGPLRPGRGCFVRDRALPERGRVLPTFWPFARAEFRMARLPRACRTPRTAPG
jgi:hypothetical protein